MSLPHTEVDPGHIADIELTKGRLYNIENSGRILDHFNGRVGRQVVGILGKIFGRRSTGSRHSPGRMPRWAGEGVFMFDVVGEAHYQPELERLSGGRTQDGVEQSCIAVLVPEPGNKFDRKAVAVRIAAKTVGYLSRNDLPEYHAALEEYRMKGKPVSCPALIVGGWSRCDGSDQGHFGVKLDIVWPPELDQ